MSEPQLSDDEPDLTEFAPPPDRVMVSNEFGLVFGKNLENHATSLAGRGEFVMVTRRGAVMWRTKQEAYRFIAHLELMAEGLPDEPGAHTATEVTTAVEKSLER